MEFENEKVDVKENTIYKIDNDLLSILLSDHSSRKNIIWGTDNYSKRGFGYNFNDELTVYNIVGRNGKIIRPRIKKSKLEQTKRSKDMAEVFTPSWLCNEQNNIIDECWFGYSNVFNESINESWITNLNQINFLNNSWKEYVLLKRLEVSCGEAPYLVSRYDTTSGDVLDIINRIGLLDRKLRIINENVNNEDEWIVWAQKAYESIYAFEWQGDSLLIARENLLYTYIDYYSYKFNKNPSVDVLKKIADIISWNIVQMDGLKGTIPNSCKNETIVNNTLFGEEIIKTECEGCCKNNIKKHNGIYVYIMDWELGRKVKFISLLSK